MNESEIDPDIMIIYQIKAAKCFQISPFMHILQGKLTFQYVQPIIELLSLG